MTFFPIRLGIELIASWMGLWLIHDFDTLIMYLSRGFLGLCLLDCELLKFVHFSPHIWKVLLIFIFSFETFCNIFYLTDESPQVSQVLLIFLNSFYFGSFVFEIFFFVVSIFFSCGWPSLVFLYFKLFFSFSNNARVFSFVICLSHFVYCFVDFSGLVVHLYSSSSFLLSPFLPSIYLFFTIIFPFLSRLSFPVPSHPVPSYPFPPLLSSFLKTRSLA